MESGQGRRPKTFRNGRPCPRGHIGDRYVSGGDCVICAKAKANARYQANKAAVLARIKENYRANPEPHKLAVRERAKKNPAKKKAAARSHYERNADKYKAKAKAWLQANRKRHDVVARAWRQKNPDKVALFVANKRAAWLLRTPKWLSKEQKRQTRYFYSEAKRLSRETGIVHQVDHIVPLVSPIVSGLHVPWNLQVLTADQNRRKSNRLDVTASL